jgi:hypothetical protein
MQTFAQAETIKTWLKSNLQFLLLLTRGITTLLAHIIDLFTVPNWIQLHIRR